MSFLFPPPPPSTLPILGDERRFPVRRIYCIGRNYAAHAREMGHDPVREPPFFFLKPGDSLQAVEGEACHAYPPGTADYHPEVELVAALHRGGRDIGEDAAMSHVFGFAVGLDMTRRDRQAEAKALGRPWDIGKAGDHGAVVGPLVPRADAGEALAATITLAVGGVLRQRANTADMLWRLPEQIAILSRFFTLAPGDLIMTGTPEGVGPVVRGDRLEARVAGLPGIAVTIT